MSQPRVLRIAMNGVTGRMGYRQHLLRSILPIRDQGGIPLPDGSRVTVEPILVGRSAAKLEGLARRHGVEHWSTDLDALIADPTVDVVFDASMRCVPGTGGGPLRPALRLPRRRGRRGRGHRR